jgi:hypothetical protein
MGVVIQKPVTNLSGYARHGTADIAQDGAHCAAVAWSSRAIACICWIEEGRASVVS